MINLYQNHYWNLSLSTGRGLVLLLKGKMCEEDFLSEAPVFGRITPRTTGNRKFFSGNFEWQNLTGAEPCLQRKLLVQIWHNAKFIAWCPKFSEPGPKVGQPWTVNIRDCLPWKPERDWIKQSDFDALSNFYIQDSLDSPASISLFSLAQNLPV